MSDHNATAAALFEKYDLDKSGTLSVEDFKPFFDELIAARSDLGLSAGEYDKWFSQIDQDGSGTISVEDLVDYLTKINYSA